jgi:hypothetical protein
VHIITSTDVSFCSVVNNHNDDHLVYLSNLYELKTTFSLSQRTEAERLWCQLTDNDSNIYLLLTFTSGYSLWALVSRSPSPSLTANKRKAVPDLVIHLLQSLWLIIADLGGGERAASFGKSLVVSNLPIDSEADLQACLVATPPPITAVDADRGRAIIAEFRRLACLQVGAETVDEVIKRLPIAVSKPLTVSIF